MTGQTRDFAHEGIQVLTKPFRQEAFNMAVATSIETKSRSATVIALHRGKAGRD
jgi:hypothetical protein